MPNGAGGNIIDNASLDGFVGDFPLAPVTDGTVAVFGTFAGNGHDRTDLLWRVGGWCARARAIGQAIGDALGAGLTPALTPVLYRGTGNAQLARRFANPYAFMRHENNPRPLRQMLRAGVFADDGLQFVVLGIRELKGQSA